jgi:hypothetical protein
MTIELALNCQGVFLSWKPAFFLHLPGWLSELYSQKIAYEKNCPAVDCPVFWTNAL